VLLSFPTGRLPTRARRRLVVVDVSDDGVGGAIPNGSSGLRGLSDRVAALSGTLEVTTPPRRRDPPTG
jgi:signal transduction histidine kinase